MTHLEHSRPYVDPREIAPPLPEVRPVRDESPPLGPDAEDRSRVGGEPGGLSAHLQNILKESQLRRSQAGYRTFRDIVVIVEKFVKKTFKLSRKPLTISLPLYINLACIYVCLSSFSPKP